VHHIGAQWAMPIRKLAALNYPFEQLHGRCAALAERVSQLDIEKVVAKDATLISNSLLARPKGQRGRPTLEAKRQSELNPKQTLEQFWKDETSTLPARFQLLEKEKPTVLLDTASNIDAFKNLLLGIRLLHYQRPLKGLSLIVACHKDAMYMEEFLKLIRYFFKKTSGNIIICPISEPLPGSMEQSWDVEKITNEIKNLKIKARIAKDLKDAVEAAKKTVDERNGLIVITGSSSIIHEYWNLKGIKKL
jgi:folylpolyglutamate synthase/dihydropteroate synthase